MLTVCSRSRIYSAFYSAVLFVIRFLMLSSSPEDMTIASVFFFSDASYRIERISSIEMAPNGPLIIGEAG